MVVQGVSGFSGLLQDVCIEGVLSRGEVEAGEG